MTKINTKRIYDEYNKTDGMRILVDRLWPRGVKKEDAHVDEWLKDIAPSDELRRWFHHEPGKWQEFKVKYYEELNDKKELLNNLTKKGNTNITLIYAAKDRERNNAVALKEFIERK